MKICQQCGGVVGPKGNRFCSYDCHNNFRRIPIERHLEANKIIDASIGCWLWTGRKHHFGHGVVSLTAPKRNVFVHRASWEQRNGPIPDGLCVLHKCDVPACFNPDHLFLGTREDNVADRDSKHRMPRGESLSYTKLTEADVRAIRAAKKPGISYKAVAAALGLPAGAVAGVVFGRSWRHVL